MGDGSAGTLAKSYRLSGISLLSCEKYYDFSYIFDFMTASTPLKDYRNRSFKGQDLSGQDFIGCDLRGCDFRDAKLQGVDFSGSRFGQTAKQRIKLTTGVSSVAPPVSPVFIPAPDVTPLTAVIIYSNNDIGRPYIPISVSIAIAISGAALFTFAAAFPAFSRGAFLEGVLFLAASGFLILLAFAAFESTINKIRNTPGTRFGGANLTGAIFVNAKLSNCNFENAILHQVNWTGAIVKRSSITLDSKMTLLIHRQGNGGSYEDKDFSDLHMAEIDLSKAVLNNSNLSRANLQHADLQDASLVNVQASGTDFRHAKLTGVCIEKWSVNTDTQFDGVICDHIFLTPDRDPQSRRPLSGSFEPGDFQLLLDNFADTLDFILRRGTDPIAFKQALNQFKRDNP
jgi:uncharacterized protein YjbI with pentapeptide repeats